MSDFGQKKTIGRGESCDYVIIDPENRVSRRHVELTFTAGIYQIMDLGSTNGTFINERKIEPRRLYKVLASDKVTLSKDYFLDIKDVFSNYDPEQTRVFTDKSTNDLNDRTRVSIKQGDRAVVFESDRTRLEDLSNLDRTGFVTIGRSVENTIAINKQNISKRHCGIRLLTPYILELEDFGSTNGTFADGQKIKPNIKIQYASSVKISLGNDTLLDLKKIFPGIQFVNFTPNTSSNPRTNNFGTQDGIITKKEKSDFYELEAVWKEHVERQSKIANSGMGFSIGGSLAGAAAAALIGGPFSIALSIGGGLLGRYLGQQESNLLKSDTNYEEMFLQVYSCPRCKESFQKKPWITIRDCFKCKLKFRES